MESNGIGGGMNELWKRFWAAMNPEQLCITCLLATIGIAFYVVTVSAKDSEVKEMRAEMMQSQILEMKIKQCEAIKKGEQASFFAGQLQRLADKYEEVTGRKPQIPTCSEL